MRPYLLLFGFFLLVGNVLFAQVDKADLAYGQQDYKQASELYQQCYDRDTNSIHCLERLALCNLKLGDSPLAKEYYHKLNDKDTTSFAAAKALAAIYEEEENPPLAIKYYTILSKQYPDNGIYARKLGRLYNNAGLARDAFLAYNKAYKINNRDVKSIKGLAELFLITDQKSQADSMINLGLGVDSMHIGLSLLSARVKYRMKKYDEVVSTLKGVLGRYDFQPYYHKLYGYALSQIDSTERAIFHLQKALVEDPEDDKIHYYLANAYQDQEDLETAEHHFKLATKYAISPSTSRYYRSLAKFYDSQDDYKHSIAAYKEVLRYGGKPENLYFLARACDLYYKDKGIAIKYYNKYINSSDTNKAYKSYARDRSRYLKEQRHQSGN